MHIPAFQATLFAILVVPICILTFYVDMRSKKISNLTVWALFLSFVAIGVFTMPLIDFAWRFVHYAVVFAYGLLLWFFRQIGAGDVKFAAVLALFIHAGDIRLMLLIAAAAMAAATLTVLVTRWTPLHRLAPEWKTWKGASADTAESVGKGKRFTIPMGTGFALMLSTYLIMGIFLGR
ncbi:prepilin peptidase [Tropicibacter oceani]|uniref:Prepilin peptidase n=1 Tax=Tropicibacter oceani TaxID=3058420 RepID=A0ABY8QHQ9_9RHOB|nr:prepilin peptidase [Tropicibacter oceani]WGW03516.1 prepilin peptidase [Tropicibacter oceani]